MVASLVEKVVVVLVGGLVALVVVFGVTGGAEGHGQCLYDDVEYERILGKEKPTGVDAKDCGDDPYYLRGTEEVVTPEIAAPAQDGFNPNAEAVAPASAQELASVQEPAVPVGELFNENPATE